MNKWFPLDREGRQSLVYLVLAGCGPAMTLAVMWAMHRIHVWVDAPASERLEHFAALAMMVAAGLLIIITALAAFVSIRAFKVTAGRNGITLSATGDGDGGA